jgi:hypothetical protein
MPTTVPSADLQRQLAALGVSAMTRAELWAYVVRTGAVMGSVPATITADKVAQLVIELEQLRRGTSSSPRSAGS